MQHRKFLPWLALGIVYIVWGSTYAAIRVVVCDMPPAGAACIRFLCAGLVMAGIATLTGRSRPSLRQIVGFGIVGVLLLGVGNALVMWAEQRVASGIAALIVATVPLWMSLLDGLRAGGQRLRPQGLLGAACGLAGVALVARPGQPVGSFGDSIGQLGGIIGLQVGALAWAAGSIYAKTIPRLAPTAASSIQLLAGAAVLLAEAAVRGEQPAQFVHASAQAWGALLYLVAFGSLLAFTAYAYCLHELPASIVGTYAYVNPVVAVLLGRLLFHEPLSAGLVGGGALITAGIVLSTGVLGGLWRPLPGGGTSR